MFNSNKLTGINRDVKWKEIINILSSIIGVNHD